jgi:hypothetical protein
MSHAEGCTEEINGGGVKERTGTGSLSRRQMLQRMALVGGTVVWAAPVVEAVKAKAAAASTLGDGVTPPVPLPLFSPPPAPIVSHSYPSSPSPTVGADTTVMTTGTHPITHVGGDGRGDGRRHSHPRRDGRRRGQPQPWWREHLDVWRGWWHW